MISSFVVLAASLLYGVMAAALIASLWSRLWALQHRTFIGIMKANMTLNNLEPFREFAEKETHKRDFSEILKAYIQRLKKRYIQEYKQSFKSETLVFFITPVMISFLITLFVCFVIFPDFRVEMPITIIFVFFVLLEYPTERKYRLQKSFEEKIENKNSGYSEPCSELNNIVKTAEFEIPLRCRRGDSHNLKVEIECPSETYQNPENYLEIELQAAGMGVNGDLRQHQCLNSGRASYLWNCNYSKDGHHIVNLVFRELDGLGGSRDVMTRSYPIEVITLWRQSGLPTTITIITAIITIILGLNINISSLLNGLGM